MSKVTDMEVSAFSECFLFFTINFTASACSSTFQSKAARRWFEASFMHWHACLTSGKRGSIIDGKLLEVRIERRLNNDHIEVEKSV